MRRSSSVTSVIAAAFLLLHLPFVPASLEDLDSINFALGVKHFDVAAHQPHPPGYPIFIGAAKIVSLVAPSETFTLSVLSMMCGALSLLPLAAMFRRLDPAAESKRFALPATIVTATAPLYWLTSARPLSDMPGLAAALAVQALTIALSSGAGLAVAAFLAGLASGIRSQVIWLTLPLIVVKLAGRPRPDRVHDALVALGTLSVGILVWFVPLVWLTGGPTGYWRALSFQGSSDLGGVAMLWTTRTPHQLLLAFQSVLVAPWGAPALAGVALVLAVVGVGRLLWASRPVLWTLTAAFGPYLAFDLLFQETITTRYTLPLVVPLAYLVVRGLATLPSRVLSVAVAVFVAANLTIAVPNLQAYAGVEAPAFRLLHDMRTSSPTLGAPPVFATHRRETLDMKRPMEWVAEELPSFSQRLSAPPKHEWLELVKYWNEGGRAPIWFVADPLRSDLALVDHPRPRTYRWPLGFPILIGGARPGEMDWYVLDSPNWYLAEGWALTPETAGVADASQYGRGRAPVEGWIRRQSEPTTMMIGGRNFALDGSMASLEVTVDGRPIGQPAVAPGFFLRTLTIAPEALTGSGDYAAVKIATHGDVAFEQFDAQPPERVVFGYAEGWHEREYDGPTGKLWRWMSERGNLQVRGGTGQPLVLTVDGATEDFSKPSHVTVRVGDRVLARQEVGKTFSLQATVPAELAGDREHPDLVITIETDQVNIPAEQKSGTADRRHLGLKIFDCSITAGPR